MEGAADEGSAGSGGELDAGGAVGDGVHAERHADLGAQVADDVGHGGGGDEAHGALIGQAELVGEEDAVHAAILKGVQILAGMLDDRVEAVALLPARVARQRVEVEHRDDGLLDTEHFLDPKHGSLLSWSRSAARSVCGKLV